MTKAITLESADRLMTEIQIVSFHQNKLTTFVMFESDLSEREITIKVENTFHVRAYFTQRDFFILQLWSCFLHLSCNETLLHR